MSANQNPRKFLNETILKEISDAIGSLEFGTVTIKVHGSKIIQIEVTEKQRFDDVWKIEEGGGI